MSPEAEKSEKKEVSPEDYAVGYVHTKNFPDLLQKLNLSLIVTTYQARRILTFSPRGEKLFMLMRIFDRPTGMAIDGASLALCAKSKIWLFTAPKEMRDENGNLQPYDLFFVPHKAYVTGDIAGHEMAYIGGELHIVNTRFSCICTLSEKYSFTPGWKPSFITDLVPEDRCHLNGMAVDGSGIRYLSALGETDTAGGWRPNKANGGIVIDYNTGAIVLRDLSMPHSPRLYGGHLWILDSGRGELLVTEPATGKRRIVTRLPGFLRGLEFFGNLAFVGVCKIREKKTFDNLPIETMFPELQCAIYAIDIRSGETVGFINFTKGIEELFDIKILPGIRNPHIIGFEEETIDGIFLQP